MADVPACSRTWTPPTCAAIVNLDGRWGAELEANLERYDRRYPGRFVTFCHLDWSETSAPGFGERLARGLRRSLAAGARGLKVWKDLGLSLVDERGELILPDDERLTPVWEVAATAGVPVLIHTADPRAFFAPVDAGNERLEELVLNPDWSYAELGSGALRAPARGPRATGGRQSRRPRSSPRTWRAPRRTSTGSSAAGAYPNLFVDIAARIAELGRQPRRRGQLIVRHPDRVLFGTDVFPPSPGEYAIHFRFLETEDEHFAYSLDEPPPQGRWRISGLGLPDDVLRPGLRRERQRLIPGLALG